MALSLGDPVAAPQQPPGLSLGAPIPQDTPGLAQADVDAINAQVQQDLARQQPLPPPPGLSLAPEISPDEHNLRQSDKIAQDMGEEAGNRFRHAHKFGQRFGITMLTPQEFKERDEATMRELKAGGTLGLVKKAGSAAAEMAGQFKESFKKSDFLGASLTDKALIIDEAVTRVAIDVGFMVNNGIEAVREELNSDLDEDAREYERYQREIQWQIIKGQGASKELTGVDFGLQERVSEETISTMELGVALGLGTPAAKAFTGTGRLVAGLGRNAAREAAKPFAKVFAAQEAAIRGKRAIIATKKQAKASAKARAGAQRTKARREGRPTGEAFEEFKGIGAPPGAPEITTINFIKAKVRAVGRIPEQFRAINQFNARKLKELTQVLASPATHKRTLEKLAEGGSKMAALAHKFGGTYIGDKLAAAAATGALGAATGFTQQRLIGRSLEEAAGGAVFGGILGGALGGVLSKPGAGISADVFKARTGAAGEVRMTQRSRGSFNAVDINTTKVNALADLYTSSQFDKMPDSYKAAIGILGESGAAPKNILYLNKKDFIAAQKRLKDDADADLEISEGSAVHIPEHDVLLLNADNVKAGADGFSMIAQEVGRAFVGDALRLSPQIIGMEAARFHDKDGTTMKADRSGDLPDIKVNKEFSDFVKLYNKNAEATGARPITNFYDGLNALYASQAGLAMNSATFSGAPVWFQKRVHQARGALLSSMGKVVQNRPAVAKSFARLDNSPMGKYAKAQFKIWQQEGAALKAKITRAYDETTNINLDEKAALARDRARREGVKIDEGLDRSSQAAAVVEADVNSTGAASKFEPSTKQARAANNLVDAAGAFGGKTTKSAKGSSAALNDGIPDEIAQGYVLRFPKGEQSARFEQLNQIRQSAANGDGQTLAYTDRTTDLTGLVQVRNGVLTNDFKIINRRATTIAEKAIDPDTGSLVKTGKTIDIPEENGLILVEFRDLDAIDHNLRLAEIDNTLGDLDFDTARAQVLDELGELRDNPNAALSDMTKVVMGDFLEPTKKTKGVETLRTERVDIDITEPKWKGFVTENNKKGRVGMQRTLRSFDYDRMLAMAPNVDKSSNFSQSGRKTQLKFTNIPEEFAAQAAQARQQTAPAQ